MTARRIRPAERADIPVIQRIYAHAVRTGTASFELDPPSEETMCARWEAVRAAKGPYLVAEDEVVVGFAYAGLYRPRPAYAHTLESSVYVAPEHAGHGHGRALMEALIAKAEGAGFRQMVAVIGDSDNRASRRLHMALGFREVGTFRDVGHKHGRWLDTVLMQRRLGPGADIGPIA
ncbi:MAG: N-acetyltransferase family protein [Pseudomonadota bacterium]